MLRRASRPILQVELQAGQRIEYKYVILEEQVRPCCRPPPLMRPAPDQLLALVFQDWTKLENDDSQGLVEITYRTGSEPGKPPDVQVIQKQMAIVAWQPGPNRILQVPTEVSRLNAWGPRSGVHGAWARHISVPALHTAAMLHFLEG